MCHVILQQSHEEAEDAEDDNVEGETLFALE